MSLTRLATAFGIAILTAFLVVVWLAGPSGLRTGVIVVVTMGVLVGAGNLLYGRHSHGAAAVDRVRPAQEAHDRAADVAAEARRAVAEAARRGERYCPLDPAAHAHDSAHAHESAQPHPSANP
jgi:hypothetical protein